MKSIFPHFFTFALFFAICVTSNAQQFDVEILVEQAYIKGYNGDKDGPRIRVYKDAWNDNDSKNALWKVNGCIKLGNIQTGFLSIDKTYRFSTDDLKFDILVVTHEERKSGSDDCTYQETSDISTKRPDRYQASSKRSINLNDFSPGVFSPSFIIRTIEGAVYVDTYIKIRYTPVPLVAPKGPSGQHCSNNDFTLTTQNDPSYNATNLNGLNYVWEYHITGSMQSNPAYNSCVSDCDERRIYCVNNSREIGYCYIEYNNCKERCVSLHQEYIEKWDVLGTTTLPSVTFNPASDIFKNKLTKTTTVHFRVRAKGKEKESGVHSTSSFSFTPPPPDATTVTIEPSCTERPTGKITVTGVTSQFSTYRYLLKYGKNIGPCGPEEDDCLQLNEKSDSARGKSFTITDVAVGDYTLFLLNNAGTEGFCPRLIDTFTVAPIPKLELTSLTPQHLTENEVNTGKITIATKAGQPDNIEYKLTNLNGSTPPIYKNSITPNAIIVFDDLFAGTYKLTVNDGCTPPIIETIEIKQPARVSKQEINFGAATCASPGNGIVKITVDKTAVPDVPVSDTYHYRLYKDDYLYKESVTEETEVLWDDLPPSENYRLSVKEYGGLDQNGFVEYFSIEGPPDLGITNLNVKDVSCFNGDDGEITVEGIGGSGTYVYEIKGPATASNSTGVFSGLVAGDYTLTIKNDSDCNDSFTHPTITVAQPTNLTATLSKQDISCNGLTDGAIIATVSGGTEGSGYVFTWETLIGTSWTPLSITGDKLTGRGKGHYRLKVTDANTCSVVSNEVDIIEPDPLLIESININDITCFGGTGNLEVNATGGTPPYTFEYTSENNTTWTSFTADTPFSAGVYTVRAMDKNGCGFTYTDPQVITAPSAALTFTAELSDFNGYNISCWGGSNGHAVLTASSGNGAGYAGYTYAVDDGDFQSEAKLEGINAGEHTLHVKDGRGCIVSQTITFTQTSALLGSELLQKQHVVCIGDETGILEIKGTGGLPPFQYSIDGVNFGSSGRFTGLGAGIYDIIIKDKNGCDNTFTDEIETIHPPMEIAFTVTDVSCFGGNDGTVSATITGGVAPFQYQWPGLAATENAVNGLSSGTYTVIVTDNAGCSREASVAVNQPLQPLTINLATVPVCYGKTDGSIEIKASGGTAPYQYSVDGGRTYQISPSFIVGVGSYTVQVQDSKGCVTTATATIEQRNEMPEPDFLVATKRNALDTLVVTDISVPKPDSITWLFDPAAKVLNADQWAPQLSFENAGSYAVTMTGYFDGCAYTVTKNLSLDPYDPGVAGEKLPGYHPIESLVVSPNPSNGALKVAVKLNKKYNLSLVIYDVLGVKHYSKSWDNVEEMDLDIVLDKAAKGIYLIRAITESDAREAKIIIEK